MKFALGLICILSSSLIYAQSESKDITSPLIVDAQQLAVLTSQINEGFVFAETAESGLPESSKLSKSQAIQIIHDLSYPIVDLHHQMMKLNPYWPGIKSDPLDQQMRSCYLSHINDQEYSLFRSKQIKESFDKNADQLTFQVSLLAHKDIFNSLKTIYLEVNPMILDGINMLTNPPADLVAKAKAENVDLKSMQAENFLNLWNAESIIDRGADLAFNSPRKLIESSDPRRFDIYAISMEPKFSDLKKLIIVDGNSLVKQLYMFDEYIFNQCESVN
uniref:hypothetical protein n=1 Tax=uncultured Acinetobacter sp. TaxID=165433 RepID=UPI00260E402C|nr:hypothetical protein [uncultured Acinetobacter sp.]